MLPCQYKGGLPCMVRGDIERRRRQGHFKLDINLKLRKAACKLQQEPKQNKHTKEERK